MKLTHYRTLKALAAQHLPLRAPQPFNCSNLGGVHGVIGSTKASPILVAFGARFLSLLDVMRLLAEILIIAALIFLWLEHALQGSCSPGKHNNLNETPRSRLEDAKTPGPLRTAILVRERH